MRGAQEANMTHSQRLGAQGSRLGQKRLDVWRRSSSPGAVAGPKGRLLGVETAVVEGDPSKPGYYLTINHFPTGVMSRPHFHPDERYVIVLRGTWYTDEGKEFRPTQTVPLKPGDFMRHPKGGPHYDGALDEDTWVAISGYGPTNATVIDGGELFGKSR
jgi:hypothetical protein